MMEEDEDICDVCGGGHQTEVCPDLGLDPSSINATQLSRARLTLPHNLDITGDIQDGTLQVVATYDIVPKTQFGPFEAKRSTKDVPLDGVFALKVLSKDEKSIVLDTSDESECNWMCLVPAAQTTQEQNCIAYQLGVNIFYNTTRIIRTGENLYVWYAPNYAKKMGKPGKPDGITKVMLGTEIGKLLATPAPALEEIQPLGKRRRKITAQLQEFLESARKKVKSETGAVPNQTPRKRGRPPKAKPTVVTQTSDDSKTEKQGNLGEGDEIDISYHEFETPDDQEGGTYKCTRCPRSFLTQNAMVKHLRAHFRRHKDPGEPVRTMFCTECGKGFVNSSNLARHSKLHNESTEMLSCSICQYETYRQDIMRTHMEVRHSIQAPVGRPRGRPRKVAKVVKKSGRPRGRPRKIPHQDYNVDDDWKKDPDANVADMSDSITPRRVLPQRSNRGKKMMEILSPEKKLSYKEASDEDDDDSEDDEDEEEGESELADDNEMEKEDSVKDKDEKSELAEPVELVEDAQDGQINTEDGEVALEEGTILTQVLQPLDPVEDISDVLMTLASGGFVQTVAAPMTQEAGEGNEAPAEVPLADLVQVEITESASIQADNISEIPEEQTAGLSEEQTAGLSEVQTAGLSEVQTTGLSEVQTAGLSEVQTAGLSEVQTTGLSEVQTAGLTEVQTAGLSEVQTTGLSEVQAAGISEEPTAGLLEVQTPGLDELTEAPASKQTQVEDTVLAEVQTTNSETNQKNVAQVIEGDKNIVQATEALTRSEDFGMQTPETPVPRKRGRPRRSSGVINETKNTTKDQFNIYVTPDNITIYGCKHCDKKFENEKFVKKHSVVHTKNFACDKCGKTFAHQETFSKHLCEDEKPTVVMTISGEEVRYSCTECGKSFVNEDYARQHATIHKGLFECSKCKGRFHSNAGLQQHTCRAVGRKKFACDICTQTFRTSGYLFRHLAMHTDIFKCNICGRCFSRKDSMLRHVVRCDPVRAISEDIHACVNCHKAYTSLDALESHMQSCYKTYCPKCKTNFNLEEEFNKHECKPDSTALVPTTLDSAYRFSCRECNKEFRNIRYLRRHETTHYGQHKCKICSKNFSRKEEFVWHIVICENTEKIKSDGFVVCDQCTDGVQYTDSKTFRQHHFTHTHPYECDKCRKRFRKQGSIVTHQCDPYQYQEGGFQCLHCEKSFSCRFYLDRHSVIHGERQFECDICKKRFFREDYLKDHKCLLPDGSEARVVRRNNRVEVKENVICHLCGASFVSKSNLTKHMKTHGEKQFECDVCGKKFHYLAYMKEHKVHVHGSGLDLQCSICGRIFKTRTGLRAHIVQFHSGVDPQHECPVCHKRFRQRGNLKTHMYSHSTSKQFHCNMCLKTFKYPDQLTRHKLEHTMKNKITCELCPKQFVKGFEYKKHMSTVHSGMAFVCSLCKEKCGHRHTLFRHFKRKHRGALHLLSDEAYIQGLLVPIKKDNTGPNITADTTTSEIVDHMEEVATMDATDVVAEAIANAAMASEVNNAPTMSIGETFTNELGETFTESVITDAEGNETRIVYRTPEGFSNETDLPQVAAEALQSLSNTIITGDETTTVDFANLEESDLQGDEQHTVVIVQIVNQDEETELGETYTIQTEDLNV